MHLDQKLATQSLGRPLAELELALARDLEAVFADGVHVFSDVASALQARGTARPSGAVGAWTEQALADELRAINTSLDAAYAANGTGV